VKRARCYGIHNQGTQKDGLTEKKTIKENFGFLLHDYGGLVYGITRMMSC
jgi:hypothetical protein